ncbi:MAG: methylmalonyl-CoA mutase family protein [Chloroflexi bacterium]|nr:methylmalonyl-CoA mutase family protein [Chloroflexota bacterium]
MLNQAEAQKIRQRRERWQEKASKAKEREGLFTTTSGIPVRQVYTPLDISDQDYGEEVGMPGEYPFTRGIHPTGYRGRLWTMRQYAGFGSAEESNRRYRYLLEQGQTGLSVAFDLPTQMGYDSDHPMARGEVGKVGVPIDTLEDMETLFDGIPLEKVTTSMTINATASILLALYIALAKKQGADLSKLGGTVQNDILKEYIARGTYIYPPRPSMRLITDLFKYCVENLPSWNTISISGYHMREAGCTAVQELAFTFANAIAYVQAAVDAGLDVDRIGGRLSFFFVSQNNLLEEVAKFRAARKVWAKIMRDRFKAKNPRSWMVRFHTQTAGASLTAQQPENNIVRVTIQALAAVLGGTQSLHTNSMDEALALPSEKAATIALRTQQIIASESGCADVIDPLAGSYYVEHLTRTLEDETWKYLEKIEEFGGALGAIEQGFIQREIQESAFRFQREIENNQRIVVGVNRYESPQPPLEGTLKIDPALAKKQIGSLARVKEQRDQKKVKNALAQLREAALGEANTMPVILECVEAYASLGEISDVLRDVFGEYEASVAY